MTTTTCDKLPEISRLFW